MFLLLAITFLARSVLTQDAEFDTYVGVEFDEASGETGPSREYRFNLGLHGGEIRFSGESYMFDDAFTQFLVFYKPKFEEYEEALNRLAIACQRHQHSVRMPSASENVTQERLEALNHTAQVVESYSSMFYKRCTDYSAVIKETIRLRVRDCFEQILPQASEEIEEVIRATANIKEPIDLQSMGNVSDLAEQIELSKGYSPFGGSDRPRAEGLGGTLIDTPAPDTTVNKTSESNEPKPGTNRTGSATSTNTPETATRSTTTKRPTVRTTKRVVPGSTKRTQAPGTFGGVEGDINLGLIEQEPKSLSRAKRQFDIVTMGVALTALAASTAGVIMAGVALKRISDLQTQMNELWDRKVRTDKESVFILKTMFGITDINGESARRVTRKVGEIIDLQQMLGDELEKAALAINHISLDNAMSHSVIFNMIKEVELTQRAATLLASVTGRLRNFELALGSLKNGFLPSQLINFNKLKAVLMELEANLPPGLQLGIPISDIQRYYTTRLTKFTLHRDKILVGLVVPLSRGAPAQKDKIFSLHLHPFPTPPEWLAKLPNVDRTNTSLALIKLEPVPSLWMFRNGHFVGHAERQRLNCLEVGDQLSCISFGSHIAESRGTCTAALTEARWKDATMLCRFKSVLDTYRPIPMINGSYVVHRSSFIRYVEDCGGNETDRIIYKFGAMADVPSGCTLRVLGQVYPGPSSKELNKTYEYRIVGRRDSRVPSGGRPSVGINMNLTMYEFSKLPGVQNIEMAETAQQYEARAKVVKRSIERLEHYIEEDEKFKEDIRRKREIDRRVGKNGMRWILTMDEYFFKTLMIIGSVYLIRGFIVLFVTEGVTFLLPHAEGLTSDLGNETFGDSTNTTLNILKEVKNTFTEVTGVISDTGFFFVELTFEQWFALARLTIVITCVVIIILKRSLLNNEVETIKGNVLTIYKPRFSVMVSFTCRRTGLLHNREQLVVLSIPIKTPDMKGLVRCELLRNVFHVRVWKRLQVLDFTEPIEVMGRNEKGEALFIVRLNLTYPCKNIIWDAEYVPAALHQEFLGVATLNVVALRDSPGVKESST